MSSFLAAHGTAALSEGSSRPATLAEMKSAECGSGHSNFRVINVDEGRDNPFDLIDCDQQEFSHVGCDFLHVITVQAPRSAELLGLKDEDEEAMLDFQDNLGPFYYQFCRQLS